MDNSSRSSSTRLPQIVDGDRNKALSILKITPDEQIAFITYLNYAVNNLSAVAGIDFSDEKKVRSSLYRGEQSMIERRLQKLADFLWTFQVKDPASDERGLKNKLGNGIYDLATWLVERIVALRNFFVHVNGKSNTPLILDQSQYVFIEGILGNDARKATMAPGLNSSKAQKLKLVASHDKTNRSYEFTRKGLIFLTCLGLYKDEAEEFCHLFREMKVPDRIDDKELDEELEDGRRSIVLGKKDFETFKGRKGKGRALIELFSFYSYRRGRQSLHAENLDFMCFADIVGYLNKVPAPALEFLPLKKERETLDALTAASAKSEENKQTKYTLRRRDVNRFLSFAAAYCEDFNVLPSLRFKRLDVRQTTGRHQYVFGSEDAKDKDEAESNRVRMNRHYAIRRDAIPFEFIPSQHYGPIRICSLRSAMSATEMRTLLYVRAYGIEKENNKPIDVNTPLRRYFEAYHRILERMVNADSIAAISLDDKTYLDDLATICGTTPEAFRASPDSFRSFIPESLLRYFTKKTGTRTDAELVNQLATKLLAGYNRTSDILVRYDALQDWNKEAKPWKDAQDEWREQIDLFRNHHPNQPLPPRLSDFDRYLESLPEKNRPVRPANPHCRIGTGDNEISNPPTSCRFSDADYVSFVFDYFNLFLPNNRKFRQLPISEQHREGIEDHLFQLVHTAIGKTSLDPKGLEDLLEKKRSELSGYLKALKKAVKSRPIKLEDLAIAAVSLTNDLYCEELNRWSTVDLSKTSHDTILAACIRFGVRPGMPVEAKSLLKTILGIDYDAWRHAYDISNGKPYENRRLENEEHIAARIPLPNEFSNRLAAELPRKWRGLFLKPVAADAPASVNFNAAFRAWFPDGQLSLRDFYDVSPLVESLVSRKHRNSNPDGSTREPSSFDSLSFKTLDATIREIKNFENQDKTLLFVAMEYWKRFQETDTFLKKMVMPFSEKTTLREFFDTPVKMEKKGITVSFRPNDINRPAFATLFGDHRAAEDYRQKIVGILSPDGSRKSFDFFEMATVFREQKARDRHERLEITPYIVNFDASCEIPDSEYTRISEGLSGAEKTEAIRKMEFEHYHAVLPDLTRKDYDKIADARNAAVHTGFKLDFSEAIAICKRLRIRGVLPGIAPAAGSGQSHQFSQNRQTPRNFNITRW